MKLNITIILYLSIITSVIAQSNEWIVSYYEKPEDVITKANETEDYSIKTLSSELNIYLVTYAEAVNKRYVHEALGKPKSVSPNADIDLRRTPNDSRFNEQYYLDVIQAEDAWDITTGNVDCNSDYVIAVFDEGFDVTHPDLVPNLWINDGEIEDDGIDNDNNGFIDDYLGLNINTNNDNHEVDDHGTRVAGVIGAKGNNGSGITGVMWDTNILVVSGVDNVAKIIASMDYVFQMKKLYIESNGARGANVIVTNLSAGIRRRFPDEFPDWCATYDLLGSQGILSVTAAPNENFNVEEEGDLPTLCDSPYLITASYTDFTDNLDSRSAFGSVSVDIAAPGESILSTTLGQTYDEDNGASFSAPQIAGAIGLMYNVDCDEIAQQHIDNPSQLALDIKTALFNGVDRRASLSETVSGGRLNIFNSIIELTEVCGGTAISELEVFPLVPNPMSNADLSAMSLNFTTDVFSEHTLLVNDAFGRLLYTQKFIPSTFSDKSILLNQVPPLDTGIYSFSVMNEKGISSQSVVVVR
ncbi:S8 family serine peptidase [Saprospiraceae bacterium]|nr:S8 family serine peptidase [Saprospiraceae bacterium]